MENNETNNIQKIKGLTPEQIKERNDKFNALPPLEKRVHVAKEVALLVKGNIFSASNGYGEMRSPDGDVIHAFPDAELQSMLTGGYTCAGCAKAAAVAARAALGDNVYVQRGHVADHAHTVTFEIFGRKLGNIIEGLYEGSSGYFDMMVSFEERDALVRYMHSIPWWKGDPEPFRSRNAKERLLAIYKNIADNGGMLVVEGHVFL